MNGLYCKTEQRSQAERLNTSNLFSTFWTVYIIGVSVTVHNMSHLKFTSLGKHITLERHTLLNKQHSDDSYHTLTDHRYAGDLPASRLNE
uniref:Vesicle transport v-SNARE 13 n=1 Tax=Arundo donax TaxID=35708 RepID=A0A0A9EKT7_ARUDO